LHAGDTTASEAEVPQRDGFADLRHFVVAYRNAFGAPPRIGQPAG
jgi:transcriptional regulator GlxA family with amidase domain